MKRSEFVHRMILATVDGNDERTPLEEWHGTLEECRTVADWVHAVEPFEVEPGATVGDAHLRELLVAAEETLSAIGDLVNVQKPASEAFDALLRAEIRLKRARAIYI